jgi:Tol biopolymer transport system component
MGSDRSGKAQVWKIPVDGEAAAQITKQGGGSAVESPDGKFVYYTHSSEELSSSELWRVPAEGGEEIRITGGVAAQYFSVVERGVYFFSGWANPSVRCYNLATRKVETVATVEGEVAWGFSLSPDSRWLLYSVYGTGGSDLMLVENFR